MNREQKRKMARKINTPQKLENVVNNTLRDRETEIQKLYQKREEDFIDVMIVMTAYTLNYKLGLGKKRLPELMYQVVENIDSFRTGQLEKEDFDTIKEEMKKLGVEV